MPEVTFIIIDTSGNMQKFFNDRKTVLLSYKSPWQNIDPCFKPPSKFIDGILTASLVKSPHSLLPNTILL